MVRRCSVVGCKKVAVITDAKGVLVCKEHVCRCNDEQGIWHKGCLIHGKKVETKRVFNPMKGLVKYG